MTKVYGIAYACSACERKVLVELEGAPFNLADEPATATDENNREFAVWYTGTCPTCSNVLPASARVVEASAALLPIYRKWGETAAEAYEAAKRYQLRQVEPYLAPSSEMTALNWSCAASAWCFSRRYASGEYSSSDEAPPPDTHEQLKEVFTERRADVARKIAMQLMDLPEGLAIRKGYFSKLLKLQERAMKAGLLDVTEFQIPQATNEPLTILPPGRRRKYESLLFELNGQKPVTTAPAEIFCYTVSTTDFFGQDSFGTLAPIIFDESELAQIIDTLASLVIDYRAKYAKKP